MSNPTQTVSFSDLMNTVKATAKLATVTSGEAIGVAGDVIHIIANNARTARNESDHNAELDNQGLAIKANSAKVVGKVAAKVQSDQDAIIASLNTSNMDEVLATINALAETTSVVVKAFNQFKA